MVVSDTIIIFFEVGIFYVMDFIFYSPVLSYTLCYFFCILE